MPSPRRSAFTLVELLVVIAIIGVLVAILLPAVQASRETARRMSCSNNLKQLALAMHTHEVSYGYLPFSKRDKAPQRSWVPDLLPFLEQSNLISPTAYDLNENWWRTTTYGGVPIPNGKTSQTRLAILQCPSSPDPDRKQSKLETPPEQDKVGACTDYFAPEGVSTSINNDLPVDERFGAGSDLRGALRKHPDQNRFAMILDGTSQTILFGECAGREDVWRGRVRRNALTDKSHPDCARARGGAWATNDNPYEIGVRKEWCAGGTIPGPMRINVSNEYGFLFYSFHPNGANFAFADGSVRFIAETIRLRTLADQVTRAGGEVSELVD